MLSDLMSGAKYELLVSVIRSYVRSGVAPELGTNAPVMLAQKGRDTGNITSVDNARLLQQEVWSSRSWAKRGGAYYDITLDNAVSPHQTWVATGGPRIGRRMGAYLSMHLTNNFVEAPVFRSGAATRVSDTILSVPLTSIGNGLSLTVATGGNVNALDQWYVGGTLIPNDASTIARIGANGVSVELVKLSGTWAVGAENNILYVSGAPGTGTTAQTVNLVLPNNVNIARIGKSDYSEVQWWVEIYTDIGATATTLNINYTSGTGTTNQTTTSPIGSTTNSQNRRGRLLPILTTNGDTIQSIQSVTLSGSTTTAGNFGIVATRSITSVNTLLANTSQTSDWAALGLPLLADNSCLFLIVYPGTTTTGSVFGTIRIIRG